MRREGGWIRRYRAHHKAEPMTTTGHIAKAMRGLDAEADKMTSSVQSSPWSVWVPVSRPA
jgi:hypothetical protein